MKLQKRLAADIFGCSQSHVKFDKEQLEDIKSAITKTDIRGLIRQGAIKKTQIKGISRVRARKIAKQKSKGRRRGAGSRKGKASARTPKKELWMIKIRKQRAFLQRLKKKSRITNNNYNTLYRKAKGGFFRSERHLKLYMEEHHLIT